MKFLTLNDNAYQAKSKAYNYLGLKIKIAKLGKDINFLKQCIAHNLTPNFLKPTSFIGGGGHLKCVETGPIKQVVTTFYHLITEYGKVDPNL